ncbi:autism susceptibility gene 2 protein homolog isoform X3 [Brachyhypopomus gauderio]|uniref:autism susceptibility gene 2 protein homolog isoform X3 n=1 Tax=Brachyhypopomus gauderio TaxID=698409 RepID=UPI004041D544
MDGPSRSGGLRQSRRSRSQRDRERRRRRADLRPSSPSSASDQELCRGDSLLGASGGECRPVFTGARHRPPRRRKRESVSCEEDIIDGFAIASFISLEALEMDCSLKPPERAGMLVGRGSKRKRGLDENGGPLTEPEEGAPANYTTSNGEKHKNDKRKREAKVSGNLMETGYICDTESESGDKASDNDMEPTFIVSTREAVAPNQVNVASTVSNGCTLLPSNSGPSRLSVTPRVSGLERSQEKSLELPYPEATSTSSSLPCLLFRSPNSTSTPLPEQQNGNAGPHHRHDCSPPRHKHKPFLSFPGRTQSLYSMGNRNSTSVKPPSSSSSSSSIRPPTPSNSVSAGRGPSAAGVLRPSSRPSPGTLFTPSPLPPPPPLLQTSPRSADQDLHRQEMNSRFSTSQGSEREGRVSASSAGVSTTSASGGPSASTSSSGTSSRSTQAQTSMPLAYQFHHHNHQHQHTHTHQHFLHPPAAATPMFEKYPGKMDLFRHPFFPQYPPPVPGIQSVLPPTGPFSSLQGAFQPKGTAPEMTARLGVVPPHLQPKDPRITDPFGPSLKVSNKPGKWCAMHVRVAWMILRHQEKVKLMQADPQKLNFGNDLLPRLPGPGSIGGIGGLGGLGGPLPPTHDLTRPGSLFTGAGGVNPSSTPFIPPPTPHSFLTPATHLDPYGRSPPFTPLGALGSGAFGGLGSPSLAASSVFGHKAESSASSVGGLGSPHDPWNRLHVAPPSFPTGPSWPKGLEKRDERDRGKDIERRELTHIKDEKDRDSLLYGRQPVRMSPSAPTLKHRSSTPSFHVNGLGPLSGGAGQSDGQSRERERERDRERDREREAEKRQHLLLGSRAAVVASSAPDRPRSSTSSVLATPPPSASAAPSPLDLFPRQPHALNSEPSHSSQRESSGPASSSSSSVSLLPIKKPDRTTTPVSKQPNSLTSGQLHAPVKVKEERKEEPEPVPISLPHPAVPPHSFERPNSRHTHHPSTPSSTLSLTPTSGVPLPPPSPHHLAILDRSRAAAIEAFLGSAGGSPGLVPPDRFSAHPHTSPQGPTQAPHSFPWDPWRELAAREQQQRREVLALRPDPHLALRSDPHLSRLLQHQHARYLEAERAAAVAAAVAAGPHHPTAPTSTSAASSSAARPEFGLMSHPFDRPHQVGAPGGGLLDEEQRAQILREDFERVRYFGMHPHLSTPHLPSPSHPAHLEQLHAGLLSHSQLHPPGASAPASHHPGLYSRLGPLHPHVPNGILNKAPSLVGPLSVGPPPPLIPSVTRASTPPRTSRLGGAGDLTLYSTHKDGESR